MITGTKYNPSLMMPTSVGKPSQVYSSGSNPFLFGNMSSKPNHGISVGISNPLGIPNITNSSFAKASMAMNANNPFNSANKPSLSFKTSPETNTSQSSSDTSTGTSSEDTSYGASSSEDTAQNNNSDAKSDLAKNDEAIKKGPGDQGQTQKCGFYSAGAAAAGDGQGAADKVSDDIEGAMPDEIQNAALDAGAKSAEIKDADPNNVQKSLDEGKRVIVLNDSQQHAYTLMKGSDGKIMKLNSQGNQVTEADISSELDGAQQVVEVKAA